MRTELNGISRDQLDNDYLFEVEREAEIVGKPLASLLRCVLGEVRGLVLFLYWER